MLFNSYEFIFGFLPLTLLGFYLLGHWSRAWALGWLIAASLVFYAWWRPINVLLIAPSIIINYAAARVLLRWGADERRRVAARVVLIGGILFNVCFLGYFKYRNFFLFTVNNVFGTHLPLASLIMPLAISFITFQKIAFLIDVHGGRVKSFTLRDYCVFVLFFPQLIAGPIVHYREMMPQFHAIRCRINLEDAAVAATLFVFGLFKKVVLADSLAPHVSALYERAHVGPALTLVPAWLAAVGFTLQIYFDFSGYTDMALGLARFFGIRLPPNFDSPLRASSIIDYWLRWHMTLTRFLTAYIYSPLSLALTRGRMRRGLPVLTTRSATPGAFLALLVFPTLLTMFVSGFWHGAGYLFILWGVVHGVYICINHAWRLVGPRLWNDRARYEHDMTRIGFVLTFLAVVFAMVLFRAPSLHSAYGIITGMLGGHGISLPVKVLQQRGVLVDVLAAMKVRPDAFWTFNELVTTSLWTGLLLAIALLCPNTSQILAAYQPALGVKPRPAAGWTLGGGLRWSSSLAWTLVIMVLTVTAITHTAGKSEFLYWQF